ncbi:MAG: hypothetical protein KBI09_06580 [Mesotoga sp.]|jgi:hypothetical protein|uniref:Uncharacterized protein n=1 Tax=Mesotoga infera TaxID=1236046 RepID=A0A7Z7LHM2_9BACT|nr:hypothetical protein [Mesotoga infera]MBP8660569.1 hypothetical protein [Mesotoga sp.]SSC13715.1 protein of unknown function [Mesotoga infera]HON27649.1 hypothetical protein [Mesotoga infera]
MGIAKVFAAMSHYKTHSVEHGAGMTLKEISDNSSRFDSDLVDAYFHCFKRDSKI